MQWLRNRRKLKTRSPLNSKKTTIGHLRALVAAQNGQLATLETQIGILNNSLQTTKTVVYSIDEKVTELRKKIFTLAQNMEPPL